MNRWRGPIMLGIATSVVTLVVLALVQRELRPPKPGVWEYGPWPKQHYSRATWLQVAPRFCRLADVTTTTEPSRLNELRFADPPGEIVQPSDALYTRLRPGECTDEITPVTLDFMFRHGGNLGNAAAEDADRRELFRLGDDPKPLLVVGIGPTGRLRIVVQDKSFVRVKRVPHRIGSLDEARR